MIHKIRLRNVGVKQFHVSDDGGATWWAEYPEMGRACYAERPA